MALASQQSGTRSSYLGIVAVGSGAAVMPLGLPEVHCKFVNRTDETWINTRQTLYACQGPQGLAAVRKR